MLGSLKPYPAYKDSGIPWLGEVPAHWKILPARAAYKPKLVKNTGMIEKTVLSLSYGRIVVKPPEKLRGLVPESFETYQVVEPGNIVVRTTDLQNDQTSLRVGYSKDRGIITAAYTCLETTERVSSSFGYQVLNTYDLLKVLYGFGSGLRQNLDFSHIKRMPVVIPPKAEQSAIVRFLDHADHRIRRFIHAKKKLIALLNEQRQAIIHRAVTRGLVRNVLLKPSGSPWLGDIAEHWAALQVRRLVSLVTSGSRGWADYYSDSGCIFLQSGNLGRSASLNLAFIQYVQPPEDSEGTRTRVERNDVLVCITGALTGNVALVDMVLPAPAFVNQHVALIRPDATMVNPRYLAFALHSSAGARQFKTNEYGGTKQGLGLDDVKAVVVAVPPISEQIAICAELAARDEGFSGTISRAEREIALIREYRTRLIADVVTGKLDIREAAASLPAELEEPELLEDTDTFWEDDGGGKDTRNEAVAVGMEE